MGMLDRFFQKKARWSYPPNKPQDIGFIPDKFNHIYTVPSRSNPGKSFKINLYKLTCTCPNFQNTRSKYGPRDARRVCPHLHKALRKAGIEQQLSRVLRMILEHGRKYRHFHRMRGSKADVAFGYTNKSPVIAIFAVVENDELMRAYNLDEQAWADGPPPQAHAELIEGMLKRAFSVR